MRSVLLDRRRDVGRGDGCINASFQLLALFDGYLIDADESRTGRPGDDGEGPDLPAQGPDLPALGRDPRDA
jgi:hypothetical protein